MIHIYFRENTHWKKIGSAYLSCKAFYDNHAIGAHDLYKIIQRKQSTIEIIDTLKRVNGFFSIVYPIDGEYLLATDCIRSMPLFYGSKKEDVYISDDPFYVKEEIGEIEVDRISTIEFLLTGYVTGRDTLYPNVKQLQSGEVVIIDPTGKNIKISSNVYFRYTHNKYFKKQRHELFSDFDHMMMRIFKRLTDWANGRPIIVPLSGGYDSRLIVLMLKRLNYKDIIAFSYGHPKNNESRTSKKVADSLGIKWIFVPYSVDSWKRWYQSNDRKRYVRNAFGLCSIPILQDWPAVWELKRKKSIPEDSIFVPGLSADLLAGSRSISNPHLYRANDNDLSKSILNYHYNLWSLPSDEALTSLFLRRIESYLKDMEGFPDQASAFESWDFTERQAKFINNSIRSYEFWGYEWWLPFWDKEFIEFWSKMPIKERMYESFYKEYINNLFFATTKTHVCNISTSRNHDYEKYANIILNLLFIPCYKDFYSNPKEFTHLLLRYSSNPLALYGIISLSKFKGYYSGKESINSFLGAELISEISRDSKNAKCALSAIFGH